MGAHNTEELLGLYFEDLVRSTYVPTDLPGLEGVAALQLEQISDLVAYGEHYKDSLHIWPRISEAGRYYTINFTRTKSWDLEEYLAAIGDLPLHAVIPLGDKDYKLVVGKPTRLSGGYRSDNPWS